MVDALGKQKPPEPDVTNLGGISSAIAAPRWDNDRIVVAGIGTDSFVYRKLRRPDGWSDWVKIGTTKAKGTLALTSSTNGGGSMYYIDASGETVEVTTSDYGDTWV